MLRTRREVLAITVAALLCGPAMVGTSAAARSPRARVAQALTHYFSERGELSITCAFDEGDSGEDPAYAFMRWLDHADPFHRGGGWIVGSGSYAVHGKVSAFGQSGEANADAPPLALEGQLYFLEGPIAQGSTLRMAWISWDTTLGCSVAVDDVPLTPTPMDPTRYGRVEAADIQTGAGVATGFASATLLGGTTFSSPGYTLGIGTTRLGDSIVATNPQGLQREGTSEEPLFLHELAPGTWDLDIRRRIRDSGAPVLVWASL